MSCTALGRGRWRSKARSRFTSKQFEPSGHNNSSPGAIKDGKERYPESPVNDNVSADSSGATAKSESNRGAEGTTSLTATDKIDEVHALKCSCSLQQIVDNEADIGSDNIDELPTKAATACNKPWTTKKTSAQPAAASARHLPKNVARLPCSISKRSQLLHVQKTLVV